jgi:NAD(P)H-flavin reductase
LRRISQTSHRCASEGVEPPKQRPSGGKKLVIGAVISLAAGVLYLLVPDDSFSRSNSSSALNNHTFRKFTVVSNEQISPTSFILTVKPSLPGDEEENAEVIRKAWEHGLWSVEFKQPQLQIARHYTPLPPTTAAPHGGDGPATLRFLIRRYEGGEVSRYLSRLQGPGPGSAGPGDAVELRGPHLGFDVAARLGDAGRSVVFLAGGTGIAPALQLASRVLSVQPAREGLSVRILWASRSALDVAGCPRLEGRQEKGRSWSFWSADGRGLDTNDALEAPGPIVQQLRGLEAAYRQKGSTLEFKCVVDEEGSRISPGDITREVSKSAISPRAKDSEQTATSTQALSSSSCHLHSQRLLQNSTEEADTQKEEGHQVPGVHQCSCSGDGATGKNLFMISGPDGFVGAYVGPKVWAAGAERQGPLGGLVGELRKKDPKIWSDWLVLKQ